jgi:hypothetical protein
MYFDHANNYWVAAVSLGYKVRCPEASGQSIH